MRPLPAASSRFVAILPGSKPVHEATGREHRQGCRELKPEEAVAVHGASLSRPRMARANRCRPRPTTIQAGTRIAANPRLMTPDAAAIVGLIPPTATAAAAMLFSHVAVSFVRSLWIRLTAAQNRTEISIWSSDTPISREMPILCSAIISETDRCARSATSVVEGIGEARVGC